MSRDAEIAESVRKHGWHAIAVEETADAPTLLYTIGLCQTFGHPEVMVFGWEARFAHSIVSDMVADMKKGQFYSAGQTYPGLLDGFEVAIRPVHATQHLVHLGYATGYYRILARPELLSAIQLFWPDKAGKFPFELACDPGVAQLQPRMALAVAPSELRAFMKRFGSDTAS